MNYFISIVLILLVVDIYYRFRNQTRFNLLTKHLAFVINHYEKILLDKKIISEDDIISTRNAINNGMNKQDFLKLKKIVVAHDRTFINILTDIIKHGKDSKTMLDDVINAIYMMNKQKLNKLQNDVHKDGE